MWWCHLHTGHQMTRLTACQRPSKEAKLMLWKDFVISRASRCLTLFFKCAITLGWCRILLSVAGRGVSDFVTIFLSILAD